MDIIAVATLVSSTITAVAAIYIAFVALQQTARPRIDVRLKGSLTRPASVECTFVFEIVNVGRWYGAPPAPNIKFYPNFDPAFRLRECRYGSSQQKISTEVLIGKRSLTYIRADHIGLAVRNESEECHVVGTTPDRAGKYVVSAAAISDGTSACHREFWIDVFLDSPSPGLPTFAAPSASATHSSPAL